VAKDDAVEALRELGFNDLEADVYLFLLSSPPLTAYKVGRALGRPTANVYKAVESLARRGAVLVEEGEQRVCRAVPVGALSRQLERVFRSSLEQAQAALAGLERAQADERVYKLESTPRLFARCEEMLAHAERIAVVDAFPRALERLTPWIAAACKRGVEVFVEAYAPAKIPGAKVVLAPSSQQVLEHWRSEQLNVVVDGREHLLALLSSDLTEIRQAVWSNSLYLSCLHHAGRLCEHTLVAAMEQASLNRPDEVLRLLREHGFFIKSEVPGQQELLARFAVPPADEPPAARPRSRRRTR